MTRPREIPAELKSSFTLTEWLPLLSAINIFFVFLVGACITSSGLVMLAGLDKNTDWRTGLMITFIGAAVTVFGYFTMGWLDSLYFRNLSLIAKFGRDNLKDGSSLWLRTKRFAEVRGYGSLFQD